MVVHLVRSVPTVLIDCPDQMGGCSGGTRRGRLSKFSDSIING